MKGKIIAIVLVAFTLLPVAFVLAEPDEIYEDIDDYPPGLLTKWKVGAEVRGYYDSYAHYFVQENHLGWQWSMLDVRCRGGGIVAKGYKDKDPFTQLHIQVYVDWADLDEDVDKFTYTDLVTTETEGIFSSWGHRWTAYAWAKVETYPQA